VTSALPPIRFFTRHATMRESASLALDHQRIEKNNVSNRRRDKARSTSYANGDFFIGNGLLRLELLDDGMRIRNRDIVIFDQPIPRLEMSIFARKFRCQACAQLTNRPRQADVSGIFAAFQRGTVGKCPSARSTYASFTPVSMEAYHATGQDEKVANVSVA